MQFGQKAPVARWPVRCYVNLDVSRAKKTSCNSPLHYRTRHVCSFCKSDSVQNAGTCMSSPLMSSCDYRTTPCNASAVLPFCFLAFAEDNLKSVPNSAPITSLFAFDDEFRQKKFLIQLTAFFVCVDFLRLHQRSSSIKLQITCLNEWTCG